MKLTPEDGLLGWRLSKSSGTSSRACTADLWRVARERRVLVRLVAAVVVCHGFAGSQQPTEPTVQPTVHRGQHVDVMNGGRTATQSSTIVMQHSVSSIAPG